MADGELKQRLQRMAGLVSDLETLGDPKVRASAKELVQLVMDLHGAALERILEILFANGEPGQEMIDQLAKNELVSSLLVLYGIHPDPVEARVSSALRKVSPDLRTHGVTVELIAVEDCRVRIRATVQPNSCGSTAAKARTMLENAIYEAAPEVAALAIGGLDGKIASGFVQLEELLRPAAVVQLTSSTDTSLQPAVDD